MRAIPTHHLIKSTLTRSISQYEYNSKGRYQYAFRILFLLTAWRILSDVARIQCSFGAIWQCMMILSTVPYHRRGRTAQPRWMLRWNFSPVADLLHSRNNNASPMPSTTKLRYAQCVWLFSYTERDGKALSKGIGNTPFPLYLKLQWTFLYAPYPPHPLTSLSRLKIAV